MASLRKKPADVAVVDNADGSPSVAANPDTPPTPTPKLDPPQTDDAAQALRRQLDAIRQGETMQQQAQIATLAAQERRNAWLEATPTAKDHLRELNVLHHAAINSGLADTSPEYFNFMEQQLAALKTSQPAPATHLVGDMQKHTAPAAPQPQPSAPQRSAIFSAPVSREVPDNSGKRERGKVTLSQDEKDMARVAGVTIEEYAKQKLRLAELRANGQYGGDTPR